MDFITAGVVVLVLLFLGLMGYNRHTEKKLADEENVNEMLKVISNRTTPLGWEVGLSNPYTEDVVTVVIPKPKPKKKPVAKKIVVNKTRRKTTAKKK